MANKTIGHDGLVGRDCHIENASFGRYTEVGAFNVLQNVALGDYSYTGQNTIVQNAVIGKFSNIAAHVRIGPTDHPMDRPTLHHITYRRRMFGLAETDDEEFFAHRESRTVRIGHDTWLGHGAIVMPEVTVGDGAVVGSGAVVTRDVEPWTIVVGVPAKTVRRRFPERICESLARIAWWDWSHDLLRSRLADLSGSIGDFIGKYDGETR